MVKRFAYVGAIASLLPVSVSVAANAEPPAARRADERVIRLALFPVVPVLGDVTAEAAVEMGDALRDELSALRRVKVVEERLLPRREVSDHPGRQRGVQAASLQSALRRIESGKHHLERRRLLLAIRNLKHGIDGIESHLELLGNHDLLVDAHVHLATAYFRKRRPKQMRRVLEQIVRLRPAKSLDAEDVPPTFATAFEQARARILSAERGRIEVDVDAPGAQVWLNGRPMGAAPLILQDVVAGRNHLVVRAGAQAQGLVVDVPIGSSVSYAADFARGNRRQRLWQAIAEDRFHADAGAWARRIGQRAGADYVALFGLGNTRNGYLLAGMLGNVRSGAWTRTAAVSPDADLVAAFIDAHAVALDVAEQLETPTDAIALAGAVPFLPSLEKPAAPVAAASEEKAGFAAEDLVVSSSNPSARQSTMVASRASMAPVVTSGAKPRQPVRDPSLSRDEPEGGREPSSAASAQASQRATQKGVVPLGSGALDGLLLPPRSAFAAEASESRTVAALDVANVDAPLLAPDGDPASAVARVQANVWGDWGFWTALGMGAAIAAGGGWLLYSYSKAVEAADGELMIEAKWQ